MHILVTLLISFKRFKITEKNEMHERQYLSSQPLQAHVQKQIIHTTWFRRRMARGKVYQQIAHHSAYRPMVNATLNLTQYVAKYR